MAFHVYACIDVIFILKLWTNITQYVRDVEYIKFVFLSLNHFRTNFQHLLGRVTQLIINFFLNPYLLSIFMKLHSSRIIIVNIIANHRSRALTALSEFLEDSFQETPQQRQSRQLDEKLAAKLHTMMMKLVAM